MTTQRLNSIAEYMEAQIERLESLREEDQITTQTKQIRKHLESGRTLTPIDALNLYGCFRLGARIFDLRDEGMNIETEMVYEGRKRYAKYFVKNV